MKHFISVKKLTIMILLVVTLFSATGSSFTQSSSAIYVDGGSGNDSNSGASTGSAFRTIQKAVNTANPGSTIFVRGGTYNESLTVSRSGTSSAPITLTRYGSENVTINGGSNIALRSSGAVSYWVLDSLTIRSTNRYTLRLGWWGEPTTDHWTVKNNAIFGANYIMGSYHLWENNNISGAGYPGGDGDGGISDGGSSHHNIYRGNNVHDFTGTNARGIWTQGQSHDNLIENNIVTNINTASGLGQCIDLDGAAEVEWRHIVRGNRVSGCSYVGIQLENVFDSIIENNVVSDGTAGMIIISYDSGVGCKRGGESGQYGDQNGDGNCQGDPTNNLVRQNLITSGSNWGWGYGGIVNWYAGAVKYWGNTIVSANSAANGGISIHGTVAQNRDISIKSNIISQGNGAAICATDFGSISEDQNNLLYRNNAGKVYTRGSSCNTDASLAEFQAMTGKGQSNVVDNPAFANAGGGDYTLASSSPAIDRGATVGTTADLLGNSRPANVSYDMGALEFGGTPSVPTSVPTASVTSAPTAAPTQGNGTTGGNLALGKPATQSSDYSNAVASRAVDGNVDGNYYNNSVSHTGSIYQPWWAVDLGASSNLASIDLYPRTDCCSDFRNINMYVLVSDAPFASTNLDAARNQSGVSSYFLAGPVVTTASVNVNRSGRYIRVQLSAGEPLALAEVVVKGSAQTPPTAAPTAAPTTVPTLAPTAIPTIAPTLAPTIAPTTILTLAPTIAPTAAPAQGGSTVSNLAQGKSASQSSNYSNAVAARAVDGNLDGNYYNNSVAHTGSDYQAWWAVDLGASSNLSTVDLYPRTDCCSDFRNINMYLLVSDKPIKSTSLNTARNQSGVSSYFLAGPVKQMTSINVNRSGRYIRVQLSAREPLAMAEIVVKGAAPTILTQAPAATVMPTIAPTAVPTAAPTAAPTAIPTAVPTAVLTLAPTIEPTTEPAIDPGADVINLSRSKTASQSSTYSTADASRAVDGNTDGNYNNNSVSHTSEGWQQWWQVDLGESASIQYINVWARSDCCEWRSSNVYLLVSDSPFTSNDLNTVRNQTGVSSYLISGNVKTPTRVDVNRAGRYIRVQLQNNESLALAEVEVMGSAGAQLNAAPMMLMEAAPVVETLEPGAAPESLQPTPVEPTAIIAAPQEATVTPTAVTP